MKIKKVINMTQKIKINELKLESTELEEFGEIELKTIPVKLEEFEYIGLELEPVELEEFEEVELKTIPVELESNFNYIFLKQTYLTSATVS